MGHVPKSIKPLKEEAAVSRGAEFLGESFIFGVATFFVCLEYFRQASGKSKDEADKERRKMEKAAAQRARDEVLERAVLRMDARLARLERTLWVSSGAEVGEEEMLRRDRAAAERQVQLARKLADTRVPSVAALAAAEDARARGEEVAQEVAIADAWADAEGDTPVSPPHVRVTVELAKKPSKEDILSEPSQRQRAIRAVSEMLLLAGPHWTHGFSPNHDPASSDSGGLAASTEPRRCTLLRSERA